MKVALAEAIAAWPLGASLALAFALQGIHAGRRRSALNEALHELRRPLQSLALAVPGRGPVQAAPLQGTVEMAATALERLEREVNGASVDCRRVRCQARPLLEAALARWRVRAELSGATIALEGSAGKTWIEVDRVEVSQALDNLIANAIEHGGPRVAIEADVGEGRLRIAVRDSGREGRSPSSPRREGWAGTLACLLGRRRRGHGLRVVRRIAARHGGSFRLARGPGWTAALLELPLAAPGER